MAKLAKTNLDVLSECDGPEGPMVKCGTQKLCQFLQIPHCGTHAYHLNISWKGMWDGELGTGCRSGRKMCRNKWEYIVMIHTNQGEYIGKKNWWWRRPLRAANLSLVRVASSDAPRPPCSASMCTSSTTTTPTPPDPPVSIIQLTKPPAFSMVATYTTRLPHQIKFGQKGTFKDIKQS